MRLVLRFADELGLDGLRAGNLCGGERGWGRVCRSGGRSRGYWGVPEEGRPEERNVELGASDEGQRQEKGLYDAPP